MDLCFLRCLLDAAQILWIVLVELVARFLFPSVKSLKNPAAGHIVHYCYCTFVTTLLRPFIWLFLDLLVRKRALCAEFTTQFRLIELTFGRMPINTKVIWCTYLSGNLCTAVERTSQMDSSLWGSLSLMHFCLFVLLVQRVERFLVSVLHAYLHRAGNYTLVFSRTLSTLSHLLSIDSILLVLFQYHVDLCDSYPLLLFLIISVLASTFRNLSFWSVLLFTIVFNVWQSGIDIFWWTFML